MSEATFTFQVDEALKEQFEAAARARHCTPDELLRDLMRELLYQHSDPEYDAWFRQKVEEGLEDIRNGDVYSHEEVEAIFKARREATRRKLTSGE